MDYGFPALLAYAFIASFLLGLLKTGRWKTVLVGVFAVWGIRVGPTELNLLMAGTNQAYGWFALLSAGVIVPTFVVVLVGSDLGLRLHHALFAKDAEVEEVPPPHDAPSEEVVEQ